MANPPILSPLGSFPQNKIFLPMAADKTFVNGQLVAQNAGGFLVPWSASSSLLCAGLFWSPSQTSPTGADGQYGADVLQCVVQMYNGTSSDAITKATGQIVYSSDGYTAKATSDSSTLSPVGQCIQFDANSQVDGAVVVTVGLAGSALIALIETLSGVSTPFSVADGGTGLASLTDHNVLLGSGTGAITPVAPGATGIPLISQGASSDPAFGTATVPGGGTGAVTLTAHSILLGQGTSAVTALGAATDGQIPIGATGSDPALHALSGDVTMTAAGVTTIGAGKVSPAMDKVAVIGGFGNEFTATVVLADSAGGATTNVAVPQKCEVVDIMVVKNTTLSASASDLVQVKNHGSGTALCNDLLLNVAASTIVRPTTLVAAQTVIALADGIDLVQPAHTTNNGATVILRCIARA